MPVKPMPKKHNELNSGNTFEDGRLHKFTLNVDDLGASPGVVTVNLTSSLWTWTPEHPTVTLSPGHKKAGSRHKLTFESTPSHRGEPKPKSVGPANLTIVVTNDTVPSDPKDFGPEDIEFWI